MTSSNFLGIEDKLNAYDTSRVVILPVPFERSSSWLQGSNLGPNAILDASTKVELYDIETDSQFYLEGIYTAPEITGKDAPEMIERVSGKILEYAGQGKFVITLGGEHTVSVAPVKAYSCLNKNLSVLHLDAHSDRRDAYMEDPYSHASAMARAGEFVNNIVSAGIRSMDVTELKNIDRDKMFFAHQIVNNPRWMEQVIDRLTGDVYVTIDLDVFDPSIMPSTGTPEPGGLDWYQVTGLLKLLAEKRRVVGFDLVELCPSENKAPDFLAAKLIYVFLSYIFCGSPTK